jgi:hypothetical protein
LKKAAVIAAASFTYPHWQDVPQVQVSQVQTSQLHPLFRFDVWKFLVLSPAIFEYCFMIFYFD